jgi:histidine ammonia-lyase
MIYLNGENLSIQKLRKILKGEKIALTQDAWKRIATSNNRVEKFVESGKIAYGITTGFGSLSKIFVGKDKTNQLQYNIVRSHSTSTGNYVEDEIPKLMMLIRLNSFAIGNSGINPEICNTMIEFINNDIIPLVPEKGSVGASGDLSPLAHIAISLIGEGKVKYNNNVYDSKDVFKKLKIKIPSLSPKDGLALLNGTQFMSSNLSYGLIKFIDIFELSLLSAAFSFETMSGNPKVFDERIHNLRPQKGQKYVAKKMREYLKEYEQPKIDDVQDAYTMRAIPQIYGGVYDTIEEAKRVLEIEINSVTDNPLIFENDILSGGNFHGEPLAIQSDILKISSTILGGVIERRIDRMMNPNYSRGLPAFLVKNPGINSGFMIWQYTAAALSNENSTISHPNSVYSIPTSNHKEDFVSMGAGASRLFLKILENTAKILAIEIMSSSQAMELRKMQIHGKIEELFNYTRKFIDFEEEDRYINDEFHDFFKEVYSGRINEVLNL